MKEKVVGECKLCGKERILTFEHVPPRSAFNNMPVKLISGEEILRTVSEDRLPWDFTDLRTRTQQRGKGGFYLCKECNSKTGAWYVPFFEHFVRGVYNAGYNAVDTGNKSAVLLRANKIRPLPIFKEIMVLFCDINHGCFGDDNLRSFLLEKDSVALFDDKRYRVFCYLARGPVLKTNGISVSCYNLSGQPIFVKMSEIASIPLGFTLFIDLPEEYVPEGCEITAFSKYRYEETASFTLELPILESNIFFSGDYRTKSEIIGNTEADDH